MTESAAPGTYRLFLAISLPEVVVAKLQEIQGLLRKAAGRAQVRWTNREQLHLTMKFLGNVPVEQCSALLSAVNQTSASFPLLQLTAGRVGFFPDAQRPRVIWVGVEDPGGQLPKMHAAIEKAVAPYSPEESENRFQAHVTLARVKQMRREEAERIAERATNFRSESFGCWTASHLDLIRSQLSSQGASYSIVGSAAFSATTHD
jgi:RNA 2',3'-cyclic 3'-phosphodiesterase